MRLSRLLEVGAISGAVAGLSIAVSAATVGRGPLKKALELEESLPDGHGGAAHEDLFSRGAQEVGGAIGLLLFGVALGVIFTIVWGALSPHFAARTSIGSTLQLGAVGFFVVVLVPFLKYPGNPPAVGDPDTVNERTVQYLSVVVFSILLAVLVWKLYVHLEGSVVKRIWIASAVYIAGLAIVALVLPRSPDAVDVAADLVWQFRLATLAGLALGWTVLSLMTGWLLSAREPGANRLVGSADETPARTS
ncbi:CbtA family protein [uncultured Ilumatobacter sp.]|mgnify:CR=1 FL=1|jgi:hypothetical protein|uniref:CbtA family protein n=1 Tax=uncultured Ilumatobacter sp. TaxID=879968 RepID=UPI00374FD0AC|tara:strand:- start:5211 stop:5957 length:747 start_codon:yes stop_codon:yes gene_type:complete